MVQEIKNINKGKYWSKKYEVNFNFFDVKKSDFYYYFYKTRLFKRQFCSIINTSGKPFAVEKGLNSFFNKSYKDKKKLNSFVISARKELPKLGKLLLKYRIPGKIKKRHRGSRILNYTSYISPYNQWRRTVRFLAIFFKKKGNLTEKLSTEVAKLKSKNFHFRKDSILNRSNRLFTGLSAKYTDNTFAPEFEEDFHYIYENDFSKKYYHLYWLKYLRSFKRDPDFFRRIHPNSVN